MPHVKDRCFVLRSNYNSLINTVYRKIRLTLRMIIFCDHPVLSSRVGSIYAHSERDAKDGLVKKYVSEAVVPKVSRRVNLSVITKYEILKDREKGVLEENALERMGKRNGRKLTTDGMTVTSRAPHRTLDKLYCVHKHIAYVVHEPNRLVSLDTMFRSSIAQHSVQRSSKTSCIVVGGLTSIVTCGARIDYSILQSLS